MQATKKIGKIVLIDDDKMINFLNKTVIDREEVAEEILEYDEPKEALDQLTIKSTKGECPDLIFLDINMPMMNGWEFMEEYRSTLENCQHTRVIILTSSIDPSDETKAKETVGISGYKSKPLTSEMIDDIVEDYF